MSLHCRQGGTIILQLSLVYMYVTESTTSCQYMNPPVTIEMRVKWTILIKCYATQIGVVTISTVHLTSEKGGRMMVTIN